MIANLKLPAQILILLAGAFALYYSGMNDFGSSETAFLCVLGLGLVYHLVFNHGSSKFFLTVISLFAVSTLFHVIYFYNQDKPNLLLIAVNLPLLLMYLILLRRILKETRRRFRWTRSRMWFIVGIALVNLYLLYSIVGLIRQFGMSFEHILFGFGTLIVKLVLLSVGLTCCVFDSQNSRKVNLLTWAFACLFLGDVIDVVNNLLFFNDLIPAWIIMHRGLFLVALLAFYFYCMGPEDNPYVESTGALKI